MVLMDRGVTTITQSTLHSLFNYWVAPVELLMFILWFCAYLVTHRTNHYLQFPARVYRWIMQLEILYSLFLGPLRWLPGNSFYKEMAYPTTKAGCEWAVTVDTFYHIGTLFSNTVVVAGVFYQIYFEEVWHLSLQKAAHSLLSKMFWLVTIAVTLYTVTEGDQHSYVGWCIADTHSVIMKILTWFLFMVLQVIMLIPTQMVYWQYKKEGKDINVGRGSYIRFVVIIVTQVIGLFPILSVEFMGLTRRAIPDILHYIILLFMPVCHFINFLFLSMRIWPTFFEQQQLPNPFACMQACMDEKFDEVQEGEGEGAGSSKSSDSLSSVTTNSSTDLSDLSSSHSDDSQHQGKKKSSNCLDKIPFWLHLVLTIIVPFVLLVTISIIMIVNTNNTNNKASRIRKDIILTSRMSDFVHESQKERGNTGVYMGSKGAKFRCEIQAQYTLTDIFKTILQTYLDQEFDNVKLVTKTTFLNALIMTMDLDGHRDGAFGLSIPKSQGLGYYNNMNMFYVGVLAQVCRESKIGNPIQHLMFTNMAFFSGKEKVGIERAVTSVAFGLGQWATTTKYKVFVELMAAQETHLYFYNVYVDDDNLKFYVEKMQNSKCPPLKVDGEAYAQTLTPQAISGQSVDFTLGGGSWVDADVGKEIQYLDGRATITSIEGTVATCEITANFPNTNMIYPSGEGEGWKLVLYIPQPCVTETARMEVSAGTNDPAIMGLEDSANWFNQISAKLVLIRGVEAKMASQLTVEARKTVVDSAAGMAGVVLTLAIVLIIDGLMILGLARTSRGLKRFESNERYRNQVKRNRENICVHFIHWFQSISFVWQVLAPVIMCGIGLMGISWILMSEQVAESQIAAETWENMNFQFFMSNFIHETQKERGATGVYMGKKGMKFMKELPAQIKLCDSKRVFFLEFVMEFIDYQALYMLNAWNKLFIMEKQLQEIRFRSWRWNITGVEFPPPDTNVVAFGNEMYDTTFPRHERTLPVAVNYACDHYYTYCGDILVKELFGETGLYINSPNVNGDGTIWDQPITSGQALGHYTTMNRQMVIISNFMVKMSSGNSIEANLLAYIGYFFMKEKAGNERAVGSGTFPHGFGNYGTFKTFVKLVSLQETAYDYFLYFGRDDHLFEFNKLRDNKVWRTSDEWRSFLLNWDSSDDIAMARIGSVNSAYWFGNMTAKIDLWRDVENLIVIDLNSYFNEIDRQAANRTVLLVIMLVIVFIVSCIVLYRGFKIILASNAYKMYRTRLAIKREELRKKLGIMNDDVKQSNDGKSTTVNMKGKNTI